MDIFSHAADLTYNSAWWLVGGMGLLQRILFLWFAPSLGEPEADVVVVDGADVADFADNAACLG